MPFLRLLGGVSLEGERGPMKGPAAQRHRLALLALLAAHYPQPVGRDKLVAWLWPERDHQHARNLLSQAVHAVRRALGEEVILASGDELRLAAGALDVDLIHFQEAVDSGDWRRGVEAYTGHFLDGFFLSAAPEFERWIDGERSRLRRAFRQALEQLAEAASLDDPAAAVEWWRRRSHDEPGNSRVALRLMEALERVGERVAALQHGARHQRFLQEEFLASPDPAVEELADRLRAAPSPPTSPFPPARRVLEAPQDAPGPSGTPSSTREVPVQGMEPVLEGSGRAGSRGSGGRRVVIVAAVVLALGLGGLAVLQAPGRTPPEVERIAVLPFANLTGDPDQDYFVQGLHDHLITELAKIDALTVYSRQSVLRYRESDQPLGEIARELGVEALVEGSVFQVGDTVRITAQLVQARPEQHLWAESHQGLRGEALALQGEIARSIIRAIHGRIEPAVDARLAPGRPMDPAAQEAYLRGLYHLERASYGQALPASERDEALWTAVAFLEHAAELDPESAAVHAKLARAYHWVASGFGGVYEGEFYPRSRAAALRALELDETESQAHASLGFVQFAYEWDWGAAERSIRRALELDANSHHWIAALYLRAAGRYDEAIEHFRMAEERNPLSDVLKAQLANAYACAGRYEEAMVQALELYTRVSGSGARGVVGDTVWLLDRLSLWSSELGRHDEAVAMMEDAVALTDSLSRGPGLGFVLARAGRVDEARALARRLEEQAVSAGTPLRADHLYAALGENDRALDIVEEALRGNRSLRAWVRCTGTYALLRDEPRMRALIEPVGFPN